MKKAHSANTEQWYCPRCVRWWSINEECDCPTHEPSGLRRSRERGLYATNGRVTKTVRGGHRVVTDQT